MCDKIDETPFWSVNLQKMTNGRQFFMALASHLLDTVQHGQQEGEGKGRWGGDSVICRVCVRATRTCFDASSFFCSPMEQ